MSEAYEALSDPNTRAVYDEYGEEGLKASSNGRSGPGPSPGSFGTGMAPGGFSFGGFNQQSQRGGSRASAFSPSDPNEIFERVRSFAVLSFLLRSQSLKLSFRHAID